ncbi:hypothetical protein [Cupriavidus sp. CuC1]|uniref:hypothetical protein n=1 Tax=Cupriavidus sp. CuC1 TaxID=3373131 RepID=UPI0037D6CF38
MTIIGPAGAVVYNGSGRLVAAVNPFGISAAGSTASPRCINVDLSRQPSSLAESC